jgi:hypothetical protein
VPVSRDVESARQNWIEELYECDSAGSISFTISNLSAGYSRTYCLGHWSVDEKPIKPSAKRRKAGHSAVAGAN